MHENEENEAMMETIPLTPTAPPLHLLFDDEGHLVDPNLTITSPPKQPRRHPAPFQDASVDQTSTTPIMTTTEAPSHDTTRLPRNSNSTTHPWYPMSMILNFIDSRLMLNQDYY